jgi:hypothetical protein
MALMHPKVILQTKGIEMKQSALNLCVLAFIAALTVIGAKTWANSGDQAKAWQNPYEVEATYDQANQDLILKLTEVVENMAACDLVVTSQSYALNPQKLSLKLESDFCPIDRLGHRSASVKWHLPMSLRGSGELILEVNGEILGRIVFGQDGSMLLTHL